jgi:hypothetical protein
MTSLLTAAIKNGDNGCSQLLLIVTKFYTAKEMTNEI